MDELRYDAFISYGHETKSTLLPQLHTNIEKFGRAWYQPRGLRIFRDTVSMSAEPKLWAALERAMAASEWFILAASPQAARSPYVQREFAWWLDNRTADRILVVLLEGSAKWDAKTDRVDPQKMTALPPAFLDRKLPAPRFVDLEKAKAADLLDPYFRTAVEDIAATLHDVNKQDLVGD